ncbi:MAG TPA: DUF308 domain-containing protein [Solirubrobacteraceae bacterium]
MKAPLSGGGGTAAAAAILLEHLDLWEGMMSAESEDLKAAAEQTIGPPGGRSVTKAMLAPIARFWWVELLLGILWLVIAAVVLKFNHASVATVGVLTGIMFLIFAGEEFLLAAVDRGATRWIWAFFGVLLVAAGVVSLIHPRETFAGFADVLGFVFLVIGVSWTVQAFFERAFNDLWWLGLISGILLVVLAFWTSGLFFLERAYVLLVFAGIWALVKGITDIVRAFEIRKLATS